MLGHFIEGQEASYFHTPVEHQQAGPKVHMMEDTH